MGENWTEQDRDAFESWYTRHGSEVGDRTQTGYMGMRQNSHWEAWKSAILSEREQNAKERAQHWYKARAWVTDETMGYDRWKADMYSLGKGTHDAYIVVFGDLPAHAEHLEETHPAQAVSVPDAAEVLRKFTGMRDDGGVDYRNALARMKSALAPTAPAGDGE